MRKIFLHLLFLLNIFSIRAQYDNPLWEQAVSDFHNKNYHSSITILDKILESEPKNSSAFYNRGIMKFRLGDLSGACEDFTSAKSLDYKYSNKFYQFYCDDEYIYKFLKEQFYKDEDLIPAKNYRPLYTRKDSLRGALRPERTCFDVTFYDLTIKIMPDKKRIEGENDIFFRVTEPTRRIQIDLFDVYEVSLIHWEGKELTWNREFNALFIDFPEILTPGEEHVISIKYSGKPDIAERPPWQGGFVWDRDKKRNYWDGVACEHLGASSWWPNKDHLTDEPDSMRINLVVPKNYTAVSNGVLEKEIQLDNSFKIFKWFVSYPINNYNVTFYIGKYSYFADTLLINGKNLLMKYYVLPENIEKAKQHFKQAKEIVEFYSNAFGEYPFMRDGFGLIESPYEGMEHQTAIAYGNDYNNSNSHEYRNQKYDYIIVHEAAHEWWGNAVSAGDMADIWIHEGFATYAEYLFIEHVFGKEESNYEINEKRKYIFNRWPLVENYNVNEYSFASNDVYTKGAMMLHCLRCTVNNDSLFFKIVRDFWENNKYKIVTTQQFIDFVNKETNDNYTPFFKKFLYDTDIPVLNYKFKSGDNSDLQFTYWWSGVENGFKMPFALKTDSEESIRLEGTTEETTVNLEGVQWFRFYNEWDEVTGAADHSLTYFRTKWVNGKQ